MSLRDIQQLVDLVEDRLPRTSFAYWFCRRWRNILHIGVNPPIIRVTATSMVTSERVFDITLNPRELQQLRELRRSVQPGAEPELALSFPLHLQTSDIYYFDRQRARLQSLVNGWGSCYQQATPRSGLGGYVWGSAGDWSFLGSQEYISFHYVIWLDPAPFGIEINIPRVMRNSDQFTTRRPPHTLP